MKRISKQKFFVISREYLLLLVIIAAGFTLRLWLSLGTGIRIGLSVDELQSAVHAFLPLQKVLQSVAMFDPHPPLYYLQLHYWMKLGTGDLWLQLNSITFSILSIISLYAASKLIFDRRVALIAALLLALSPFSIAASLEVRMYALLVLFGIWQWFFSHRFIKQNKPLVNGAGLLIASLAVLYTHGAAFLLWMGSFLYGSSLLVAESNRQLFRWRNWIILQVVILVLYLPWLFNARSIELGHLLRPDYQDVAYSLTQLLLGIKFVLISSNETLFTLSFIAFLLFCLVGLTERRGRRLAIAYVLVPIITAIAISYVVRPIWVSRTLAFIPPFLYLAFALAVSRWMSQENSSKVRRAWILLGLLAVVSLAGAIYQNLNYRPWSHIKESVAYVSEEMAPGDIIYLPSDRVYWGWNYYFSGPGSVEPQQTGYEQVTNGVLILGKSAIGKSLSDDQRYWVIHRRIDDTEPFDSYEGRLIREIVATFRNVNVELIELQSAPSGEGDG